MHHAVSYKPDWTLKANSKKYFMQHAAGYKPEPDWLC